MWENYKALVFWGLFFLLVPPGIFLALANRWWERFFLFITIFFTCRASASIHFFSHEHYRGTSRGFELTIVDITLLILLMVLFFRKEYKLTLLPPGTFLYWLYLLISVISIVNADVALYSWFEVLKMVRMYFCYWIFFNYFQNIERINLVLKFFGVVIVTVFLVGFDQKYFGGQFQIRSTFDHQNSLAMYIAVLGPICCSMLLNSRTSGWNYVIVLLLFAMCSALEIFTLSRGGMACYGIGLLTTFILTFLTGFNSRKVIFTVAAIILLVLFLMYSLKTVMNRIENAPVNSKLTRYRLAHAARNMANDEFFGVGLNNFYLKVNPPYHYNTERPKGRNFDEGLVETTYLMIAAETGWLNLGVFLMYIGLFYAKNLLNVIRYRHRDELFLAIGLAGGMTAIFVQSSLEWVLKQTCNFYQLMIIFAIIAAMSAIYRREQHAAANHDESAPALPESEADPATPA